MHLRETVPGADGGANRRAVAEVRVAARCRCEIGAATPKAPVADKARLARREGETVVMRKVVKRTWPAMVREVAGGAEYPEPGLGHSPSNQARILQGTYPGRNVNALLDQIDVAVGEAEGEREFRRAAPQAG